MSEYAIEIKNLTKIFLPPLFSKQPKFTALKNISLNIEKGKIFTILGPNGAGKTTLIRIISGLTSPSEGEVKINGLPISKKSRASVGLFTSEMTGFWTILSGTENLELFCGLQNLVGKEAKARSEELIELFGMSSYISKPVYTYSNGMKHKLLLARSFIHKPDILLLDEPINSLDPIAVQDFHDLVRNRLNRELGKTIFLSTHQLEEAQEMSDTLGFLFEGNLIWEKNADQFRLRRSNLLDEYVETVNRS